MTDATVRHAIPNISIAKIKSKSDEQRLSLTCMYCLCQGYAARDHIH